MFTIVTVLGLVTPSCEMWSRKKEATLVTADDGKLISEIVNSHNPALPRC